MVLTYKDGVFFLFLIEIHRVKNNVQLSRWLCCHPVWQVRIDGIKPKIITAPAKAGAAFPAGCPGFPWACRTWCCGSPDVQECLWPHREPLCPVLVLSAEGSARVTWLSQILYSLCCLSLGGGNTRLGGTRAGGCFILAGAQLYIPSSAAL